MALDLDDAKCITIAHKLIAQKAGLKEANTKSTMQSIRKTPQLRPSKAKIELVCFSSRIKAALHFTAKQNYIQGCANNQATKIPIYIQLNSSSAFRLADKPRL